VEIAPEAGKMNSRDRVVHALNHQEPDRVPFDLGGTGLSTIHVTAYGNLRKHLMLLDQAPRTGFMAEQLVLVDNDVAELKAFRFPDPLDDARFAPLRARAEAAAAQGNAVALAGPSAGLAEVYSWLRGYEEYYVDLALNPDWVAYMLDRLVEFKSAFLKRALAEIGDLVDVVVEADDLGGQNAPLMSPRTYRKVIQPRHRRLFSSIKQWAPVKVFYHTCGAVRKLIPDLIDAGIDILNPIQIS
jgi:uroporphyrinogen-III decarboxylase